MDGHGGQKPWRTDKTIEAIAMLDFWLRLNEMKLIGRKSGLKNVFMYVCLNKYYSKDFK